MPKRTSTNRQRRLNGLRAIAFAEQGGLCFWCARPMRLPAPGDDGSDPALATAEHLVPRSRGGTDRQENVVAACAPCNNRRYGF